MSKNDTRLNGICPYFTMFPLDFPLRVLRPRACASDWVFDPFSGRGTTNYAARLLGLASIGIDSSPVAGALTQAKLTNASPSAILDCYDEILGTDTADIEVPTGEFWELAFHPEVLRRVCLLRASLLELCQSDARKALRAIVMGGLHGPLTKSTPSYLSNQCTRTYAPKPRYSVKFWRNRGLLPPMVDVRELVRIRAERYYANQRPALGTAITGDSREVATFEPIAGQQARWIITSPPYYGMRTYLPDQWLRGWFVGGPATVDYSNDGQLDHPSPEEFAGQLRSVWRNTANVATSDARMVVRFGGIGDRQADPLAILKESLRDSPWALRTIVPAGSADAGKRQSQHFAGTSRGAKVEWDAWAFRN